MVFESTEYCVKAFYECIFRLKINHLIIIIIIITIVYLQHLLNENLAHVPLFSTDRSRKDKSWPLTPHYRWTSLSKVIK